MQATQVTNPSRTPFSTKVRSLAIGTLVAVAISAPAVSAAAIATHDAGRKAPVPVKISPASHRLAITLKPNSVRLT